MGPLALIGMGGDMLGGLTKMIGGLIGGLGGDSKTANIISQVGSGISGITSIFSGGLMGMLSKGKF